MATWPSSVVLALPTQHLLPGLGQGPLFRHILLWARGPWTWRDLMAMLTWPLGVWLGPILVASAGLRMGVWGLTGKHPSVGSLSPQGWRTAGFQCTPHSMLEVWQSWPRARPSSATSPSPTGAAAAGGHRAGLPRPGPSLPALLLLLAVLPTAQERGASGCRLLLHRLVRDHRHAGLQRWHRCGVLWQRGDQ